MSLFSYFYLKISSLASANKNCIVPAEFNDAQVAFSNLGESTVAQDIAKMLREIHIIRAEAVKSDAELQLNLSTEGREIGCFNTYGTVTLIHSDYVLIENRYLCEAKDIVPLDLQIGDRVYYTGFATGKNNEEKKVHKIISKIEADWETQLFNDHDYTKESKFELNKNNFDLFCNQDFLINNVVEPQVNKDNVLSIEHEKRQFIRRKHIGKVDKRKGREIYLDDDIVIDLDKVNMSFVPVIGDLLQLDCLVEVNKNVSDLRTKIWKIIRIRPHRTYNKVGKVTEYSSELQYGTVDKFIVFNKLSCLDGYLPCIGDTVVVQSIESDQGLQMRWRALGMVPIEDVSRNHQLQTENFKSHMHTQELKELIAEKQNILISKNVSISMNVAEEKIVDLKVTNSGDSNQEIIECLFLSEKSKSQLSLLTPENNDPIIVQSKQEIVYSFKCKAKFVGNTKELIIFKFKNFEIGRIFQIIVNSIQLRHLPQSVNSGSVCNNAVHLSSVIPKELEDGMYIKGIKPYKTAKFIPVRPVTWKIPSILWSTIDLIIQEKKTRTESEFALQEKIPCLSQPLNLSNYKQRFNYLLYLEEIANIINMQKFNMDSAIMHRNAEYLTLNVPGLAEKRPSLIVGDRIIVRFKWGKDSKNYEGFIHKIRSSYVFLKFNPSFHEFYLGEDCQVEFKASTTVMQRCHAAIGAVVNNLGQNFLFPTRVELKNPQYIFIDEDKAKKTALPKLSELTDTEERLRLIQSIVYGRQIKWFNKKLNKFQKEAVKNVLKGVARPMPYVIFGPPGTGKTVTVVEAILQIYFTISESRILIATPSNSSANLIAERLLNSKVLQPGDLVRLVAYHYLESNLIPEKLLPYCMTADIAEEGTRSSANQMDSRGCFTQASLRTLCRHRIMIGTCAALGVLYNMGCKSGYFTHIFVDESGQASEPEIMIPLSLAHKSLTQIVLAGDPKQLGPVNQSCLAGYFGLNNSFLVRLLQQFPYLKDTEGFESGFDPRLVSKLLINYRSLQELLSLPNKLFYDSELISQIDCKYSNEAKLLERLHEILPKRVGSPSPITFHCVYGTNMQDIDSPSWYNREEATQIYIYLLMLYNSGLHPDDVGIITPYSKQVYYIKNLLAHMELELPKVGSVEEFQGQERQVIILSTVRTCKSKVEEDIRHSLGFIAARERLNVAITRARALLIIIGHPELLQQDVYWRNILQYCIAQGSIIGYDTINSLTSQRFI